MKTVMMFVALATACSIATAQLPSRQDLGILDVPNHGFENPVLWRTNSPAAKAALLRLIETNESAGFEIILKNFDGYSIDTPYVQLMGNSHEQYSLIPIVTSLQYQQRGRLIDYICTNDLSYLRTAQRLWLFKTFLFTARGGPDESAKLQAALFGSSESKGALTTNAPQDFQDDLAARVRSLAELGKLEEARKLLSAAVKDHPNDPVLAYYQGLLRQE